MLHHVPFDSAVSLRFAAESPDIRRRARLVAAFSVLGLIGGTTLCITHLVWFGIPPEHVLAPIIGGLICLMGVPFVLVTGSICAGGHFIAAGWAITVGWGVLLRGGIGAPPVMCLPAIPLIALVISGRRAGIFWITFIAIILGALAAGPGLPDLMPAAHRSAANVLAMVLFGSLLAFMGMTQEWMRRTSQDELAEAQHNKHAAEREAHALRENRLAGVGHLAASMAHEINNPLSYVIGNLEHLETMLGEPDLVEAARDALDGARRMRTIVRDLKTYSRADRADDDAPLAPVNLENVVRTTLRMVSAQVRPIATVRTEIASCPPVIASEHRLGQVLVNLLVNASQAFPLRQHGGNEITVTLGADASGDAQIEVRDNGAGMTPEVLARVTEPFFTTKPVGVGTGLGLSVCDNLVRRFGGRMRLTSRAGVGTTVTVVLPRATVAAPALRPSSPTPPAGLRILVVDEDAAVLRSLRRVLGGHKVTGAPGGGAALKMLRAGQRFDVVLCEPDLVETLAARDGSRLVVMAGTAPSPRAQAVVATGRYPVVHKPFETTALLRALASA